LVKSARRGYVNSPSSRLTHARWENLLSVLTPRTCAPAEANSLSRRENSRISECQMGVKSSG
jgi:hypothetical protein